MQYSERVHGHLVADLETSVTSGAEAATTSAGELVARHDRQLRGELALEDVQIGSAERRRPLRRSTTSARPGVGSGTVGDDGACRRASMTAAFT
ncbi:hypothetical protein ACRAWF_35100 [Streptomyces sp. L7]